MHNSEFEKKFVQVKKLNHLREVNIIYICMQAA
jgi:hypothetical protein